MYYISEITFLIKSTRTRSPWLSWLTGSCDSLPHLQESALVPYH